MATACAEDLLIVLPVLLSDSRPGEFAGAGKPAITHCASLRCIAEKPDQ